LSIPFTFDPVEKKPTRKKKRAHNLGRFPKNSMILWLDEGGNRTPLRLYIKDEKGLTYMEFQEIIKIRNRGVEKTWVLKKATPR